MSNPTAADATIAADLSAIIIFYQPNTSADGTITYPELSRPQPVKPRGLGIILWLTVIAPVPLAVSTCFERRFEKVISGVLAFLPQIRYFL
jgi:hypothetical protein